MSDLGVGVILGIILGIILGGFAVMNIERDNVREGCTKEHRIVVSDVEFKCEPVKMKINGVEMNLIR